MIMTMLRKFTVFCLALTLCLTTVACGGENQANSVKPDVSKTATPTKLNDGEYQVQQGTYNDANGEYTLFLLNNNPPSFATEKLQMARLTEEEIKAGKKTYLKVENGQPALYLTEDFKLEYVHNVTETKTNPQTGQKETVIVRQESNFWTPFAASLAGNVAGQAIGSMFRPQYYVPPVYQPGGVMTGYGGYGSSYDSAVSNYRSRYNEPPAAVRNRTTFRTTGNIRNSASERATTNNNPTGRASGSGFGGSNLRPSDNSSSTHRNSGSSFGSGGRSSSRRSSGFGSRRR